MRPAFSNALYYPTIDIQNTTWLKTTMLFWDSIATIVPESLEHPYKQYDTQYLADIGFLRPLYVNSKNNSVVGIENDVLNLMQSPEFSQVFNTPQSKKFVGVWSDEFSNNVKELCDMGIHSKKISYMILNVIKKLNQHLGEQDVYYFNNEFTYIYMIMLANKLCEDYSLGMITDDVSCFNINNIARLGNQNISGFRLHNKRTRNQHLEQGLLLNLIMRGITISPDTTISEIVSFKKHHHDELSKFKTQLSKLTQNFTDDIPVNIIQYEIQDLYNHEFIPAFNDFKAALSSSKIKWITDSFFKVALFSTSATSVPMALLGMPVEQALLSGMGLSIITSSISYNINKKNFLRNNPYSYLLSIRKELSN